MSDDTKNALKSAVTILTILGMLGGAFIWMGNMRADVSKNTESINKNSLTIEQSRNERNLDRELLSRIDENVKALKEDMADIKRKVED